MKRKAVIDRETGKSLDERFTDLADTVSEGMGRWWVSVIAFVLIAAWTMFCAITQGGGWWYGQFYNFPLNLVTTVAELFIGFWIAAAANRVERRNRAILDQQTKMLEHNLWMHEQQLDLLASVDALIQKEAHKVEQIEHKVDDIVE